MKWNHNKNGYNKKNKRGIIELQFNWIFIVVAGTIMFLFIIAIVFSQKNNSEKQTNIQISNQITTLLKGKQQTADVYSELTFPTNNINFRCEVLGSSPDLESYFTFRIADSERIVLPTEIIFAPKDMKTNKLIVWTQAFNLGIPINIFSYITPPNSIILIIDDTTLPNSNHVIALNSSIPSNITHKIIDSTDISKYNNYKNKKIVCFNGVTCTDTAIGEPNYLEITPSTNKLFDYGKVTFHQKTHPPQATLPYITKAGLYGAVFSDNAEYYGCQMTRALNHYEIKRDLTERRLIMLSNFTTNNECKIQLNLTLKQNIIPCKDVPFEQDYMKALFINSSNLENRNVDLTLSSCPKIY